MLLMERVLLRVATMAAAAAAKARAKAAQLLPIILALLIFNALIVNRASEAEAYLVEGGAR